MKKFKYLTITDTLTVMTYIPKTGELSIKKMAIERCIYQREYVSIEGHVKYDNRDQNNDNPFFTEIYNDEKDMEVIPIADNGYYVLNLEDKKEEEIILRLKARVFRIYNGTLRKKHDRQLSITST